MIREPALALCLALAVGCASTSSAHQGGVGRKAVVDLLEQQRSAWNRGDLRGFVDLYATGDEMTFCGSGGITRGSRDLLAKYQSSYPTAAERGHLTFELVEFRRLGPVAALVLGRYHLQRATPDQGWFTLIVEDRPGEGLRITHDHTSSAGKPK